MTIEAVPTGATVTSGERPEESAWRSVARSAGTRVVLLPISAILGVVITRLIIENFGRDAFAQYGLLVAIGTLLPFADLGMAAAIMNAVGGSDRSATDDHVRRVLITSIRVLICSASVLLLVTGTISLLGLWPTIMGEGLLPGTGPLLAAACLAMIAVTLPISFGQRVLSGLGKNHVTIAILGLQTPVVLAVLLMIIRFDLGDGSYLAVVPYLVTFGLSVVATILAGRLLSPAVTTALRAVPKFRSVKGAQVFDVAWPMLLQMIALPLAMQSDRLVLSHVSDSANLARYNLSAQMYLPVWQVVTAAGIALWPIFARARVTGNRRAQSPLPLSAGFAGAAALACLAITLVAPWLARLASDGQITIPFSMSLAFSVFMILQAVKYPLGMFMTDAPGLRYQAFLVVAMLPVNLGLSIVLAKRYGAVGPIIGSMVGVFLFQVVGNFIYVRKALRAVDT